MEKDGSATYFRNIRADEFEKWPLQLYTWTAEPLHVFVAPNSSVKLRN